MALWQIADDLCGADGALITEHTALVQAEDDYRAKCRAQRRQVRQAAAQAQIQALQDSPAPGSSPACLDEELLDGRVAEDLVQVVTRLVQSMDRRDAMRLAGAVLTALGLSGLDPEEMTRVAQAAYSPGRFDAQVIENLAITLNQCKRQEDKLGPCAVLDTVTAQHQLVHRLLEGGYSEQLRKALSLVDSARALLQPWAATPAVRTLDTHLHAYRLLPATPTTSA